MYIPSLLYGHYRDVRRRCRKGLIRFLRGQPFIESFEADGLLDTATTPGVLVLAGPAYGASDVPRFHCYMPVYLFLSDQTLPPLNAEQEDAIFTALLERP